MISLLLECDRAGCAQAFWAAPAESVARRQIALRMEEEVFFQAGVTPPQDWRIETGVIPGTVRLFCPEHA